MTSGGGLGGQEVGGGDENQPAVSIQLTTNNPHEGNKTPLAADPGLVAIQVSKIPAVPVVAQPQQIESSLSVQVTKTPAGVGGGHEPVSLHVTKTPIQQQHEAAVSIHLPVGGAHEPVSIHVTNNPMSGHESGSTSGDSHQSGQTERLKVEDALNYLDQVKYKFGNQPQVYNDFLDIMKEFKSQSIDTPGVISRVSNLFRGHPELIVGFNTFLPPGYKIEVQTHDQGSQISYRVDGVGYVVANMISNPLPTTTQQTSTSQIIQHAVTSAGVSIRPISSHSSHATTPATTYERNSALPGWAGIGNNGSISPPLPAVTLTPTNANFPATCSSTVTPSNANFDNTEPSSAFTHSFTSPFVQNAFPSLQSQPVQFNHAINYVNKIKNRFCGQPDKYKQFLDILHTYQKEQRNVKEGIPGKQLSEHEVYSQVSKIFENQEDLLQEFGQFLPESNHVIDMKPVLEQPKKPVKAVPPPREYIAPIPQPAQTRPPHGQTGQKRNATTPAHPISTKKPKLAAPYKDISIAEAARYGTLQEYAFFDKMRSILKHQAVFDNFIRCLYLFNKMIFSRQELLLTVQPFFCKSPEMFAWLKEFVNRRDDQGLSHEPISQAIMKQERVPEEQGIEIGEEYFSTCKRLGASYCALPKGHVAPTASGRTQLDKEVLNDVWVSFPTWSEDSTFVTSRKTQFEEYICRCEDERFELDVVIESNAETIKTLDAVARRMARMTTEELSKFTLDDCLGGRSEVVHQRSIRRVYGDKAHEIIEGMKQNPFVVIPIVLKRLKMKEDEWRESQKDFNKIWRDQVMRFYLKSLDHQGITFKQTDMRMIRSKALINEIETIYDERHEQETPDSYQPLITGPHFTLQYTDRVVLDDACNLLLHHVRRLSGIQNDDKRKIKQLLKHFIPDLFLHTRMELSDDEHEGSNDDHEERKSPVDSLQNGSRNGNKRGSTKRGNSKSGKKDEEEEKPDATLAPVAESRRTAFKRVMQQKQQVDSGRTRKRSGSAGKETRSCGSNVKVNKKGKRKPDDVPPRVIRVPHADADETYTMFYVNNAWYVFLRLHQIMCERLGRMLDTTAKMMAEDAKTPKDAKISAAVNLKMRNLNELEIHEYYPAMLEMIKNVLDGNLESNLYEDSMRELYGINAYISYTMDKVVTNAVRQLQTLVTEEMSLKFTELFFQAQKKGATGGVCDTSEERAAAEITYQKQAEKIDPEENCYKVVFYHKAFRMSVELLEGANIEENIAETTKWSAYIDSYTSHPCTGMDIKLTSLMKPVFLNRNVAVGQQYHANKTYPPEIAKIFGLEPEDVKPDLSLLDCDKTIPKRISANKPEGSSKFMLSTQTLAPVTPEEAEELEKQLERNSKRRSELVQKEQEAAAAAPSTTVPAIEPKAPIPPKNYLVTNNPVTPEEAERLEKVLEANAKRRAEAANAVKSPYVIKENLQCKFQPNSYKMIYVVNSENYFYLKGSLKRAKESHKKVSTRMNDAFGKWHQSWLEDRVTEDQIMRCDDFLMSTKNTDTKIVSSNDISLPPYRPVNHYVVKK